MIKKIFNKILHGFRLYPIYYLLLYTRYYYNIIYRDQNPVIILTIGKVGSTSIFRMLKKNRIIAYHSHKLTTQSINDAIRKQKRLLKGKILNQPIRSKALKNVLERYSGKVYIITIIREPISRELSNIFHRAPIFYPSIIENEIINPKKAKNLLEEKIQHPDFIKKETTWFNDQIFNLFKIDIYSKEFDYSKKYQIYNHNNTELLLLRQENIDSTIEKAILKLLNKDIKVSKLHVNSAESKSYRNTYRNVKNEFKLEKNILEYIYQSRFFDHFYNDMRDFYIHKWS